jgi:xanthine/CO dehydrogenase XdhC/CoxF family maturation factor
MKELLAIVSARRAAPDLPFALATVVGVEGSSYRRPGARMLIGQAGRVTGSVSGGCLEEDIILHGQDVMASGRNHLAIYDTAREDDLVFGTGLGCRGRIEILIEPVPPGTAWPLEEIVDAVLKFGRPIPMATPVQDGPPSHPQPDADFLANLTGPYPRRQTVAGPEGTVDLFIERIAPPPPLVVFGAGPDVSPLVRIARELGYHITIVDRRRIAPATFPEAHQVLCGRPAQMPGTLRVGPETAVVIMNHHYETDKEALAFVLPQRVAYVGMLGPRKRTDRILGELAEEGAKFPDEELSALHAPAGLDLGSENPEQIALSILAEMQASLTGRSAAKLRFRAAPINAR